MVSLKVGGNDSRLMPFAKSEYEYVVKVIGTRPPQQWLRATYRMRELSSDGSCSLGLFFPSVYPRSSNLVGTFLFEDILELHSECESLHCCTHFFTSLYVSSESVVVLSLAALVSETTGSSSPSFRLSAL